MRAVKVTQDVRSQLLHAGWSFCSHDKFSVPVELAPELNKLVEEFNDLPLDPYSADCIRRRRYGRFVYLPWAGSITEQVISPYLQPSSYNITHGDLERHFAGLTAHVVSNEFFLQLIRLDFELSAFPESAQRLPIDVGVHMVAYEPTRAVPAVAAPNRLHRDGEPYTFVHLMRRNGVEGGENVVANNVEQEIGGCILRERLDTFAVRDDAVLHTLKEVRLASQSSSGVRAVLIIDFTAFKRDLAAST